MDIDSTNLQLMRTKDMWKLNLGIAVIGLTHMAINKEHILCALPGKSEHHLCKIVIEIEIFQ